MSEIFETMTKRNIGIYTVRVWRTMPFFNFGDDECLHMLAGIFAHEPMAIFKAVKAFPDVSALEITNAAGQGIVWYAEWP